jgi:hypothetical protein
MQWPELWVARVAVDRQKLLWSEPLETQRWEWARDQDELVVPTTTGPVVLHRMGRRDPDATQVAFNGSDQGLFALARHPEHVDARRGQHDVEIECQGLLCSTSRNGVEAVRGVRAAIENLFYPGRDVAQKCYPGRTDVALDTVWCAPTRVADAAIERELFAHGHQDHALSRIVTRSRAKRRATHATYQFVHGSLKGSSGSGRSITWGKNPQVIVYEKDKEAGRDWPLVQARLSELGWNGEFRVTRTEIRFHREFFHDNTIEQDQRACRISELPFDEFRPLLPVLAMTGLGRFRHIDRMDENARRHRRRNSPLWIQQLERLEAWRDELVGDDWRGAGEIKSMQRAATLERATKQFERSLVRMQIFAHDRVPGTGLRDVAVNAADAIERGESVIGADELKKMQARLSRKLAMVEPPAFRREAPVVAKPDAPACDEHAPEPHDRCPLCGR